VILCGRTFATKTEVAQKNVEKMKVTELKELCEELRLSKTGKKADLVERICEAKSAVSAVEDEGMEERDVVVKKTEKQMVALLRRVAESVRNHLHRITQDESYVIGSLGCGVKHAQ
jgi:hypothetical protein